VCLSLLSDCGSVVEIQDDGEACADVRNGARRAVTGINVQGRSARKAGPRLGGTTAGAVAVPFGATTSRISLRKARRAAFLFTEGGAGGQCAQRGDRACPLRLCAGNRSADPNGDRMHDAYMEFVLSGRVGAVSPDRATEKYVQDYFADFARNEPTDFKRAQVKQILVHRQLGAELDSLAQEGDRHENSKAEHLFSNVYLSFSNYVHGKYPETMDLYGGRPAHFHLRGMSGTPKEPLINWGCGSW
jgi:hypothetical protein